MNNRKIKDFQKIVWNYYRKNGRSTLPWRKTRDPYRILVSELMLQQTQVERVLPFYRNFLKKFPTIRVLAKAPLAEVLRAWQGLGYNRRAKYLHEAAKTILTRYSGRVPREYSELIELPGIGSYTASAIRTFAWDKRDSFIETNIRNVYLHHFFPHSMKVPDSRLLPLMKASLGKNPRKWYCALMDYGAYLKRTEGNASRRSAHHVKQKPFKGSDREVRGAIVKLLAKKVSRESAILKLPFSLERIQAQCAVLCKENLITRHGSLYMLSQ